MAAEIDIPDEALAVAAQAVNEWRYIPDAGDGYPATRMGSAEDMAQVVLAAAVPLLRAQWEAEQREEQLRLINESERWLREHGDPVEGRPPGWCRWHQMADCHGDTPECRETRAEQDGDGDG